MSNVQSTGLKPLNVPCQELESPAFNWLPITGSVKLNAFSAVCVSCLRVSCRNDIDLVTMGHQSGPGRMYRHERINDLWVYFVTVVLYSSTVPDIQCFLRSKPQSGAVLDP